MSRRAVITVTIVLMMWLEGGGGLGTAAAQVPLSSQVSERLWERLLIAGTPPVLRVAGNSVRSGEMVLQFYMRRLFWPAWSDDHGLLPQIESFLTALREAESEGLKPREYHLPRLEQLLTELRQQQRNAAPLSAAALTDVDLLLTDALLTYGSHLLYGRMTPRASEAMFDTSQEKIDLVGVLREGLETSQIAQALQSLLPLHPSYAKLRQALAQYRQRPDAASQVRQIAQNMERWRWLPQELGRRYILVDVPAYTLQVVEREQPVLTMRVVVGKPSWPTPVLSAIMSHVVLNPDWNVPPNIAAKELLPILRSNPGYLAQHNMRVSHGPHSVSPHSINWGKVSTKNFPYRLRQEPGPKNPLGTIKFMFPNRFAVYLHDTPSRTLFAKPERAFSHGCVRVEKPLELAEYVLRGALSRDRLFASLKQSRNRTVVLTEPVPIYFMYRTAWVKDDGTVQFQPDIYGYDDLQERGTTEKIAKNS